MMEKLNSMAFGLSAAIVSALLMIFLGIAGRIGIYAEGVEMMSKWHLFFDTSSMGIVTGTAEAAVISYILAFLFAVIYNQIITLTKR